MRLGWSRPFFVGLVPGIRDFSLEEAKTWMAGTSPAMTNGKILF
jgi:hypothetical protein